MQMQVSTASACEHGDILQNLPAPGVSSPVDVMQIPVPLSLPSHVHVDHIQSLLDDPVLRTSKQKAYPARATEDDFGAE